MTTKRFIEVKNIFLWLVPILALSSLVMYWLHLTQVSPGLSPLYLIKMFLRVPPLLIYTLPCLILFALSCYWWLRRPYWLSFFAVCFTSWGWLGFFAEGFFIDSGLVPIAAGFVGFMMLILLYLTLFIVSLLWRRCRPGKLSLAATLVAGLYLMLPLAGLVKFMIKVIGS